MRVLITGGAGFIGSNIADACIAAGHEVAIVDDLSTGQRRWLPPKAEFFEVDIRTPELENVFDAFRPEAVCHQAARANVRESMEKPLLYAEVNVLGSLRLLECCRHYGVRKVVYASTGGAVYGEPRSVPVREDHPINPLDPYGASKHHVEHYLYLYKLNYGLGYAILRYPNVYGPRQNPCGEAGVVAIFAAQMLTGKQPVIHGSGRQERDFLYIADVVSANLVALQTDMQGIFNIGSGHGTSVNRIFELLAHLTGFFGPKVYAPAKAGEVFRTYLDARAAMEAGWRPRFPLAEGLRLTVEDCARELAIGSLAGARCG